MIKLSITNLYNLYWVGSNGSIAVEQLIFDSVSTAGAGDDSYHQPPNFLSNQMYRKTFGLTMQ